MSTYKERVDFVYRDLLKAYHSREFDKRIKLSEETNKKIRKIAMEELNKLHEEKWQYKNLYQQVQPEVQSNLRKEIEDIRVKLLDNSISAMEKEELKLSFQEKKLELEENIKLLPEFLDNIKEQQQNVISDARKKIIESYKSKPIKVADKIKDRAAKFFFKLSARIIAKSSSEDKDYVDVNSINSESMNKDINGLFNSAEQDNVPVQVSNFVDSNMANIENNASVSSEENTVSSKTFVDSNVAKIKKNDGNSKVQTFESMMGIGDNKDNMEKVDINENASKLSSDMNVVDDIELTIPIDSSDNNELNLPDNSVDNNVDYGNGSDQLNEYGDRLATLMKEMENEEDVIKLSSMKEEILKIKKEKNSLVERIKQQEQRKIDAIKHEEQELLEKESAKKKEARKCLVSEMKTLGESVSDDLDNAKSSIQTSMEETAATISNITSNMEEVKKSIEMYESFITPSSSENTAASSYPNELDSMINDSSSVDKVDDSGSKTM